MPRLLTAVLAAVVLAPSPVEAWQTPVPAPRYYSPPRPLPVRSRTDNSPRTAARAGDEGNPLRQAPRTQPPASSPTIPGNPPPVISPVPPGSPAGPGADPQNRLPAEEAGKDAGLPTAKQLADQIAAAESSKQLDETTKAELLRRLKSAADWLRGIEESHKRIAQYQADIQQAATQIDAARRQLSAPQSPLAGRFHPGTTLHQMEQVVGDAVSRRKEAEAELTNREAELKRRGERRSELARLAAETKQRLAETEKLLTNPPVQSETPELAAARKSELDCRLAGQKAQLELFKVEQQRIEAQTDLLPLLRDLAKRNKDACERQVAALQEQYVAAKTQESRREAQDAQRQLTEAHPAIRGLAAENAKLAESLRRLTDSASAVSKEARQSETKVIELKKDLGNLQDKLRYAGHTSSIGLMLRLKRGKLPSLDTCRARVTFVDQEMARANLERLELLERRAPLSNLEDAQKLAVDQLDPKLPAALRADLAKTVTEMVEKKRDLIDKLVGETESYLIQLTELEVSQNKLASVTGELAAYIDEHVLWIRSGEIVQPRDAVDAWRGLCLLASPGPWWEAIRQSGLDGLRKPLLSFALLAGVLAVFVLHSRFRRRLRDLCQQAPGAARMHFRPTVEGLTLASLLAASIPISLALVGWRLQVASVGSGVGFALGAALQQVALVWWVGDAMRQICKSGGLAEIHFAWPASSLVVVRAALRWLAWTALPLMLLVTFAQHYRDGELNNSVGRLGFLSLMLVLAHCLYALLFSRNSALRETIGRDPAGWLAKLRPALCVITVGIPLVLFGLAAFGYYYSALQLAVKLKATFGALLGLTIGHALAARWFLVKRRNLAIEQARQRQADAQASGESAPVADDPRDLNSLHEELTYLLRSAMVVGLLAAGWLIWSDVMPAFKVLDSRILWWTNVSQVEERQDANGQRVQETVETRKPITLRHALIAAVLLAATLLVGKNLPALLEITLLARLPLDRGARHAASVILRYVVALIGMLMALRTLNVQWSSVQWLAAGMTVGLGFGLQEIFANLVSGMILLFERPIRVGDVITLGDITGTVRDIRIRATTVVDWDRKELIVPNKDLITGRLLNWTLSDTLNRIVIEVGVAYKSDLRKARELMLSIAKEHEKVLEEPGPNVTFQGFGDSTLNFVLRCYVSSLDVRLATIHELHATIHDRFHEAGLEIAFPQRDLHLRTVASDVALFAESENADSRAA